jgi:hypothetical protein
MKFICLGYLEEEKFETMPPADKAAILDECLSYDDVLRKNGHFSIGEALQPANTGKGLRWKNGKVVVTDGPFAETREVIGGLIVLEAHDLNHAVELMSKHPGVRIGPWEIRPAADLNDIIRESEKRREKKSVSRA